MYTQITWKHAVTDSSSMPVTSNVLAEKENGYDIEYKRWDADYNPIASTTSFVARELVISVATSDQPFT